MIAREAEIEMEMACRGLDRDEAELVVDARLARELAAGATGDECHGGSPNASAASSVVDAETLTRGVPAPAASFQCVPCPCGGLCDNCEEA